MQALKALVVVMGILIAIGITVIGVTIYRRATDMGSETKATTVVAIAPPAKDARPAAPPVDAPLAPPLVDVGPAPAIPVAPAAPPPPFGVRVLDLPAGSIIVSAQPFEARVLAQVRLPDGATRILLLDPITGDIAGEWRTAGGVEGLQVPARPRPDARAPRP